MAKLVKNKFSKKKLKFNIYFVKQTSLLKFDELHILLPPSFLSISAWTVAVANEIRIIAENFIFLLKCGLNFKTASFIKKTPSLTSIVSW